MLTIEQIKSRLEYMNISKVAEGAGLHPNSVYRIANSKSDRPSHETIKKLSDFLEGFESE